MSFQKQLKSGDSDEYVRHAVSKNLYDPRSINELENKFARDVVEKLKHLVLNDAQIRLTTHSNKTPSSRHL
jgi:hypothetical protein